MVTEPQDPKAIARTEDEPPTPAPGKRARRPATAARSRIHGCVKKLLQACARHAKTADPEAASRSVMHVLDELRRLLPASAKGGQLGLLLKQWTKRHPLYWGMTPEGRHVVDRVISTLRAG